MLKNIEPQSPSMQATSHPRVQESDVSIIRREFVDLTGDHFSAVILNQLLYWTLRVKDFDLLLEEECRFHPDCNISPRHGWIYKTAEELNEETMLGISHPTMRKYLKLLIDQGWIDERSHPTEKWNKTTQYRVNLRKLQEDLLRRNLTLPAVYLQEFARFLKDSVPSKNCSTSSGKLEEISNVKNLQSNERILQSNVNSEEPSLAYFPETSEIQNVRILHSNEKNLTSNESDLHSNVKNLHAYTYTENTTENINREQQHTRVRVCEEAGLQANFFEFEDSKNLPLKEAGLKNSDSGNFRSIKSILSDSASKRTVSDSSLAAEMLNLWDQHVAQHLPAESDNRQFHLTAERKDQLESLFAFHFKNDMRLWEQFCLRVKASSFLMGHGARRWTVDLGWILKEGNVSKILSGKYDDSHRSEQQDSCEWKLDKIQSTPALNAEKTAILASIKNPVWKKWCTQLAQGVYLQGGHVLHYPLSTLQLQQIANARFLEVEDDRLVWVASSDQSVLNAIENLRLKISWVFAKEYPKATTFRTRLLSEPCSEGSASQHSYPQGEHHE